MGGAVNRARQTRSSDAPEIGAGLPAIRVVRTGRRAEGDAGSHLATIGTRRRRSHARRARASPLQHTCLACSRARVARAREPWPAVGVGVALAEPMGFAVRIRYGRRATNDRGDCQRAHGEHSRDTVHRVSSARSPSIIVCPRYAITPIRFLRRPSVARVVVVHLLSQPREVRAEPRQDSDDLFVMRMSHPPVNPYVLPPTASSAADF